MESNCNLFGVDISLGTRDDLLARAVSLIGRGGAVATVNPEILNRALTDTELKHALSSSLCIPDGVGVVLALGRLGYRTERLPGVELGELLLEAEGCIHLGIIGGREGIAERAMQELTVRHRSVIPEFALCGYAIDHAMVEDILRQRRPDVVFVCLGSPAQEIFISRMRHVSEKTLFIGLGGSADIYSGAKRRAPVPIRRLGLEWAWRMMVEPQRLKRAPSLLNFYLNVAKFNRKSGKIGKNKPKLGG